MAAAVEAVMGQPAEGLDSSYGGPVPSRAVAAAVARLGATAYEPTDSFWHNPVGHLTSASARGSVRGLLVGAVAKPWWRGIARLGTDAWRLVGNTVGSAAVVEMATLAEWTRWNAAGRRGQRPVAAVLLVATEPPGGVWRAAPANTHDWPGPDLPAPPEFDDVPDGYDSEVLNQDDIDAARAENAIINQRIAAIEATAEAAKSIRVDCEGSERDERIASNGSCGLTLFELHALGYKDADNYADNCTSPDGMPGGERFFVWMQQQYQQQDSSMMALFEKYPMYAGWFTESMLRDMDLSSATPSASPLLPVPLMAVVTANERAAVEPFWPDNDSLPMCASDPVTGKLVPVWKESRVALPRFYWELAIRLGGTELYSYANIGHVHHQYTTNKADLLNALLEPAETLDVTRTGVFELLKKGSKCPPIPGFEVVIERHNDAIDAADSREEVLAANRELRSRIPPVIAAVAPRVPRALACKPGGDGGDAPAPSVEQAAKFYTAEAFKELVCDQQNLDRRLVDDARLACIQRAAAGCEPIKAADLSFLATVLDNESLKAAISGAYSIEPAAVGLSPELTKCRLDCTPGKAKAGKAGAGKAGGGGGGDDGRYKVDELKLLATTLSTAEFQKVLAKQYGIDTTGRTSAFDDAHIATLVDGLLKPKTAEGGIKAADVQILAKLLPPEQLGAVLAANYAGLGGAPTGDAFQANVNRFQANDKAPTAAELETLAKLLPGADVAALLEARYGLDDTKRLTKSRKQQLSEFRAHALRKNDPPPKLPTAAELETLAKMLPPKVMAQFLHNTYEAIHATAGGADVSLDDLAEAIANSRAKPTTSADIAALAKYLPPSAMAKLVRHSFPVLGTEASPGAGGTGASEADESATSDASAPTDVQMSDASAASRDVASGGDEDPLAKGFQSALRPSREDIEFMANLVTPETLAKFIKDPHAEIEIEDTKLRQHVASKRKHLTAEELEMALAVTDPGKRSDVLKAHYEGLLGIEDLTLDNNALETVTHRRLDRADIELLAQILSPAQLQRVVAGRYHTGDAQDNLQNARVENYARSKQRIPADELERLAVLMSPEDFRNTLNASYPGVQFTVPNAQLIQIAAKRKLGPKRLSIDEIKTLSRVMNPTNLAALLTENFGATGIGLDPVKLDAFVASLNGKTADMKVADILAMAPFLTTASLNGLLQTHVDRNAMVDGVGHQCLLQRHCKVAQGQQPGNQPPPPPPGQPGNPGNPGAAPMPAPPPQPQPQPFTPTGYFEVKPEPPDDDMLDGGGGEADETDAIVQRLETQLKTLRDQLSKKEVEINGLKKINANLQTQRPVAQPTLKEKLASRSKPTDETTLLESAWSLSVAAALVVHQGEAPTLATDNLPTFVNTDEGAACQGMTRSVACVVAETIRLFGKWGDSEPPDNGFPEADYVQAWKKASGTNSDDAAFNLLKTWLSPAVARMLADDSQYKDGENAGKVIDAFLKLVAQRWRVA